LQFLFWYHRQVTLGWWDPSSRARGQGRGWIAIWDFLFKPFLKKYYARILRKEGWEGRYQRELQRLKRLNYFPDLEEN
jgi:anaerobic magnesium-protoporphyrin IX monomethyl ester cyclase